MFVFGVFNGYYKYLLGYYIQVCILFKCVSMEENFCGSLIIILLIIFKLFVIEGNFFNEMYVYFEVILNDLQIILGNEMDYFGYKMVVSLFNNLLVYVMLFGCMYVLDIFIVVI